LASSFSVAQWFDVDDSNTNIAEPAFVLFPHKFRLSHYPPDPCERLRVASVCH
jgi:hypothetical protein